MGLGSGVGLGVDGVGPGSGVTIGGWYNLASIANLASRSDTYLIRPVSYTTSYTNESPFLSDLISYPRYSIITSYIYSRSFSCLLSSSVYPKNYPCQAEN